jgi:hypothetical protein
MVVVAGLTFMGGPKKWGNRPPLLGGFGLVTRSLVSSLLVGDGLCCLGGGLLGECCVLGLRGVGALGCSSLFIGCYVRGLRGVGVLGCNCVLGGCCVSGLRGVGVLGCVAM